MPAVARIELSPSMANAVKRYEGEEKIRAWVLARELLGAHPEYGGGAGAKLAGASGPEEGDLRTAEEWLQALNELYDPALVSLLHGRLVIWGLAQLEPPLKAYLQEAGFLQVLEKELEAQGMPPGESLRQPQADGTAPEDRLQVVALAEALALEGGRDADSVHLLAAVLYEGAVDGGTNAGQALLEALAGAEAAVETTAPSPEQRVIGALRLDEHYGLKVIPSPLAPGDTPPAHTAELDEALARARWLGIEAGQRTTPHKRDLLGALLAPQALGTPPAVQAYLRALPQDLSSLRRALLEHVQAQPYGDDVAIWEQQLLAPEYLPPNAGYISDAVDEDAPDLLDIEDEVSNFAHVLMAKRVQPPLSLGLFGDWGSGKSFFMSKLRKEIGAIAEYYRQQERQSGKRAEWCSRVVQIDFNAWHFSDANLWASLVTRIYDALYAELSDDVPSDKETRERLQEKVQEAEGHLQEARAQLEEAKSRVRTAESTLQAAEQRRAEEEESLRGLIDDVGELLPGKKNRNTRQRLSEAAESLGYPEAANSYAALEELHGDLQTFSQRLAALGVHVIQSPWTLLVMLLAVVALPLGASLITQEIVERELLQESGARIVQASSLLFGVATWLKFQVGRGLNLIKAVETGLQEAEKARRERFENDPEVQEAQQELSVARVEEEAARSNLETARGELYRLQSALEELRPERKLFRLIEERSRSGTYTQHLGIISLIRSDFESISDLLRRLDEEKRDLKQEPPPVQRIILYIDDLDRCRPERVVEVLEAVHMLLAFPLFIVVVGVDPRWLRRSLSEHYIHTLGENGEAEAILPLAANRATPQQYLEKIFQIPFALRPVEEEGYQNMVSDLLKPLPDGDGQEPGAESTAHGEEETEGRETPAGVEEGGEDESIEDDVPAATGDGERVAGEVATEADSGTATAATEEGTPGSAAAPAGHFTPLSPEQLTFESWEEEDVKRLWPMFRTPRTVKRFVNIYRLLRAGLRSQEAVQRFAGTKEAPGVYQVPLILLAVVTGYPSQAARFLAEVDSWLDGVEAEGDGSEQRWSDMMEALKEAEDAGDGAWESLTGTLEQVTSAGQWQPFTPRTMRRWALRVSRYSFALDSSQALYEEFRE